MGGMSIREGLRVGLAIDFRPYYLVPSKKRGHPLFLCISEPQRQELRFRVEEMRGDNWVKQIRWIRLVGLSLAGVEDIVETMPKSVGRLKADL